MLGSLMEKSCTNVVVYTTLEYEEVLVGMILLCSCGCIWRMLDYEFWVMNLWNVE